ncbi:ABC transporter permease subunit [bacterium]|nr:ABC transporter permease subunit [bacterium]
MLGAWDITCKDLKLLVLDKRALVLLLLLPLLFIAILGMSTGQFLTTKQNPDTYRIAIIDGNESELSELVIRNLKKHQDLEVLTFANQAAVDATDTKEHISAVLTIGPQFTERVDELNMRDMMGGNAGGLATGPEVVDLKLDVRPTLAEGDLIKYFLFGEIYRTIFPEVAARNALFRPYLPEPEEETAATEDAHAATATTPATKPSSSGNVVYRFLVPGFTVMFVFFLINIMARSFIAEREMGTLRRLQLAPIPPVAVLVGKTLPFYLASIVQTSLLFLSGRLLFDMSWGPEPIYLIPVILCTSAAATSLGLMLAAWVRTDQQVSAFGTSLVLILGGISGCFIPRAWLPDLMKTLSLATPHAWSLRAFDAVLTHDSVDSILVIDHCFVLLGFATVFFAGGWWRFRQVD